jgi:hypothetical protein
MDTVYPHFTGTLMTETLFFVFLCWFTFLRAAWWSSKIQAPYFGEDDNRVCMAAGVVKVRKVLYNFTFDERVSTAYVWYADIDIVGSYGIVNHSKRIIYLEP